MSRMNGGTREWGFSTRAIRLQAERSGHREHAVPLYLTSSFVFDTAEQGMAIFAGDEEGLVYSRYGNPNTEELVHRLCSLEGTEDGLATSTGMAAMFAATAGLLSAGDHVVSSRAVFGSTFQILSAILPRWGIETSFVDPTSAGAWAAAVRPNTRILFAETPSNPGLEIVDLAAVADIAHDAGAAFIVDNCFATPYLQRPAEFGADLVAHSATKFMDGQGRVLGGAVLGRSDLIERLRFFTRQTGPALSPFNAWVLSRSLETLAVRMERHSDNAEALARYLLSLQHVESVRYPFLESHPQAALARRQMRLGGGLVTIDVAGGQEGAMAFMDALGMVSLSSNLGDTRSIATHPASTTHSKLTEDERLEIGIRRGTVRISVGLEDVEDVIADVSQALEASGRS